MCEYCENLNDGRGAEIIDDERWTDRFNLYKDNEGKYRIECYADHSSPINYCPMCGRKLTNQTTAQQGKGKNDGKVRKKETSNNRMYEV